MMRPYENPFRVSRLESLEYRASGFNWDAALVRLADNNWHGEIVGPHGSGKTTLMLGLKTRLEATGIPTRYFFLNDESSPRELFSWSAEFGGRVVLVDGAERLGLSRWLHLLWTTRQARGLVVTRHTRGRLPLLHECEASPEILSGLLMELGDTGSSRQPLARELFIQHRGNIREVFFSLYDECAGRPQAGKA